MMNILIVLTTHYITMLYIKVCCAISYSGIEIVINVHMQKYIFSLECLPGCYKVHWNVFMGSTRFIITYKALRNPFTHQSVFPQCPFNIQSDVQQTSIKQIFLGAAMLVFLITYICISAIFCLNVLHNIIYNTGINCHTTYITKPKVHTLSRHILLTTV